MFEAFSLKPAVIKKQQFNDELRPEVKLMKADSGGYPPEAHQAAPPPRHLIPYYYRNTGYVRVWLTLCCRFCLAYTDI